MKTSIKLGEMYIFMSFLLCSPARFFCLSPPHLLRHRRSTFRHRLSVSNMVCVWNEHGMWNWVVWMVFYFHIKHKSMRTWTGEKNIKRCGAVRSYSMRHKISCHLKERKNMAKQSVIDAEGLRIKLIPNKTWFKILSFSFKGFSINLLGSIEISCRFISNSLPFSISFTSIWHCCFFSLSSSLRFTFRFYGRFSYFLNLCSIVSIYNKLIVECELSPGEIIENGKSAIFYYKDFFRIVKI